MLKEIEFVWNNCQRCLGYGTRVKCNFFHLENSGGVNQFKYHLVEIDG